MRTSLPQIVLEAESGRNVVLMMLRVWVGSENQALEQNQYMRGDQKTPLSKGLYELRPTNTILEFRNSLDGGRRLSELANIMELNFSIPKPALRDNGCHG